MLAVRILCFVVGVTLALGTAASAVRTFVVPRAVPVALSRTVFIALRWLFTLSARRSHGYIGLDRRLAFYAPTSLLALPAVWLSLMLGAFSLMFWSFGQMSPWESVRVSGSSLLTLGYATPTGRPAELLSFIAAAVGVTLLALLITYLPTIYGAFTRRETLVSLLEVRAGTPPWAVTMLIRYQAIGLLDRSDELFQQAELWFADIEESHTSLGSLAFFRSPQPERSWITAAGALLDAASLSMAAVELPDDPHAALCVRSGTLCLRRISDFFDIEYDPDPQPGDPITISRDEFDDALDRLVEVGTPIRADREQAWKDFAGWRVNYDKVLLSLASLCQAPLAPWTSDRALPVRPKLRLRRRRPRDKSTGTLLDMDYAEE